MRLKQKQRIAQAFDRSALQYDVVAQMQQRYGVELMTQLVSVEAEVVCDVGCGTAYNFKTLRHCFPNAVRLGLDCSKVMLNVARTRLLAKEKVVQADFDELPLAQTSCDVLCCYFALQWADDLSKTLQGFDRVLKPNALLSIATFGEQTLNELASCTYQVTGQTSVNTFVSQKHLIELVQSQGFVIESQRVSMETLYCTRVLQLLHYLKALGANTVLHGVPAGLGGKARLHAYQQAYQRFADSQGKLPATFEILLMTARKGV